MGPLHDSSDAVEDEERCRAVAQKWRERTCKTKPRLFRAPTGRNPRLGQRICHFRQPVAWLPAPATRPRSQVAHSSPETQDSGKQRWQRDCSSTCGAMRTFASSRGSRTGLLQIPDRLTESVPTGIFAVANNQCFYTLKGTERFWFRTQILSTLGHHRPLSVFGSTRSWRASGHATEFTGTADDAAL